MQHEVSGTFPIFFKSPTPLSYTLISFKQNKQKLPIREIPHFPSESQIPSLVLSGDPAPLVSPSLPESSVSASLQNFSHLHPVATTQLLQSSSQPSSLKDQPVYMGYLHLLPSGYTFIPSHVGKSASPSSLDKNE